MLTRCWSAAPALLALLAIGPVSAKTVEVTTSDGVTLHVADEGEGEPVLLLHGLAASADLNWRWPGVLGAVKEAGFRVIAPDARGHGRSTQPADGAYGTKLVDDVVAVLDALQLERVHVVGYSMGGMTALALVARHPERVRDVFLGGMGWVQEGALPPRPAGRRDRTPRPLGGPGQCMRTLGELGLSEEQVRAIEVPARVAVGELDPIRRLYVQPLERLRPDWPVQVIPGVGHLTCVAHPQLREAIVGALKAWREGSAAR